MKILILCDNYPPETNANARIFSELAELWAASKQSVTVLTSNPNFPTGKLFDGYKNRWFSKEYRNNVEVIRVKTYMYPNRGLLRRTMDFLSFGIVAFFTGVFQSQKKHEIIVAVSPQFFCALGGVCLALFKKKPFVLIVCDLWPDSVVSNNIIKRGLIYRLIKRIEHWMYRKSQSIIVLSQGIHDHIAKMGIPHKKIITSISGASADFYPRIKNNVILEHYNLSGKFVVGYIGTFGASHSLEDILFVAKSLKQAGNKDIVFFMLGEGIKKDTIQQYQQEHRLDNLIIDGPFCKEDIPEYWSIVDVSIVPLAVTETNKTVLPSKILEGMAMGIPSLLYAPDGNAQEFLLQHKAGWHIPGGDIPALEGQLKELAKNRIEMAAQKDHLANIAKSFSRKKQSKLLLEYFSSALREQYENN